MTKKTLVISLGGSMIVPDEIDTDFLKRFRETILELTADFRVVIVCGGGKTARKYIEGGREVIDLSSDELDWVGIMATRINAQLVKAMFPKEVTEQRVVYNPTLEINFEKDILIGAGWKPGFSTDYDAVMLAKQFGAQKLVNLSNIEYVYDKDPKVHADAKKIEHMNWDELQAIVGTKWEPGLNAPFDPIATKEAQGLGLTVGIIKGSDLESLKSFAADKPFQGTTIK